MDNQIATIRKRFETELQNSSSPGRFHPIDIARVRTEEWQVKRYLLDNEGHLEHAYNALVRTLEWKAKWAVHENRLSAYPREAYDIYSVEAISGDREGRLVFCEAARRQRHYSELERLSRNFVVAWAEHVDRLVGEEGVTYVADLTGASFLKADLGLTKFRVNLFRNYYPMLAKRILLHNVPKVCIPPLKLAFSFFKKSFSEAIVYTSGDKGLFDYIDPEVLHTDYGGERVNRIYPVDSLPTSLQVYEKLGLKREFVEKFLKENNFNIEENNNATSLPPVKV